MKTTLLAAALLLSAAFTVETYSIVLGKIPLGEDMTARDAKKQLDCELRGMKPYCTPAYCQCIGKGLLGAPTDTPEDE